MKIFSKSYISAIVLVFGSTLVSSCNKPVNTDTQIQQPLDMFTDKKVMLSLIGDYENRLNIYFPVTLSVYPSHFNLQVLLAPESYRLSGCLACQQYRGG